MWHTKDIMNARRVQDTANKITNEYLKICRRNEIKNEKKKQTNICNTIGICVFNPIIFAGPH